MQFMTADLMASDTVSKKAKFIATKVWEEALSELRDAPQETLGEHFMRVTAMMYWVSSGEVIANIPMPDGFWELVKSQNPEVEGVKFPELEA